MFGRYTSIERRGEEGTVNVVNFQRLVRFLWRKQGFWRGSPLSWCLACRGRYIIRSVARTKKCLGILCSSAHWDLGDDSGPSYSSTFCDRPQNKDPCTGRGYTSMTDRAINNQWYWSVGEKGVTLHLTTNTAYLLHIDALDQVCLLLNNRIPFLYDAGD